MRLFIDPSINDIGWAKFAEDKANLLAFGTIRSRGLTRTERLVSIDQQMAAGTLMKGVTNATVETTSGRSYQKRRGFGGRPKNQASLEILNSAIGAIETALARTGIVVEEIAADVWKRGIPARRKGQPFSMNQVLAMQNHTAGKHVNEHEADAIQMGEYWFLRARFDTAVAKAGAWGGEK